MGLKRGSCYRATREFVRSVCSAALLYFYGVQLMKNQWKTIRTGFLLLALPLVATAAASAHSWIVDSNPISIESSVAVLKTSAIGNERVHTVALNRNGAIEGRIASIDATSKITTGISGLKVYFIQNGEVVKDSYTAVDGSFVIRGVAEGAYSFVAAGEGGFAAYGVQVVSDDSGEYSNVMEAAAVSPRFDVIRNILNNELPTAVANEILESSGVGSATEIVGSNKVLIESGVLSGRVVALDGSTNSVEGTKVHIIRNGSEVAEVQVDANGEFTVSGLEPGVYGFVAAGSSGFAAVSFEAVQLDDAAIPVSVEAGSALPDMLEIRLTATQDGEAVGSQLADAGVAADNGIVYDSMPIEYASDSIACGGACGSAGAPAQSGGGGGGGGGYGRGGRLAIWAALGVGIAALATSGDSGGNPPPASNATP